MQAIEAPTTPTSLVPHADVADNETKLIVHDQQQQTFRCRRKTLLLGWRNVLFNRYSPYKNAKSGLSVIWEERDINLDLLSFPQTLPSLPQNLFKTFCQIYFKQTKCITLTLHYNKKGDGSCLIQGNHTDQWVDTEFKTICEIVDRLQKKKQNEKLGDLPKIVYPSTMEEISDNPSGAIALLQTNLSDVEVGESADLELEPGEHQLLALPSPEGVTKADNLSLEEMASPSPGEVKTTASPSPREVMTTASPSPEEVKMAPSPSPGEEMTSASPSLGEEMLTTTSLSLLIEGVTQASSSPGMEHTTASPSPGEEQATTSPSPGEAKTTASPCPGEDLTTASPSPEGGQTTASPSPGEEKTTASPSPGEGQTTASPSPGEVKTTASSSPEEELTSAPLSLALVKQLINALETKLKNDYDVKIAAAEAQVKNELRIEYDAKLADAKVQVKNELKVNYNAKMSLMEEEVACLRKENSELTKTNSDLKSQMKDIKKDLKPQKKSSNTQSYSPSLPTQNPFQPLDAVVEKINIDSPGMRDSESDSVGTSVCESESECAVSDKAPVCESESKGAVSDKAPVFISMDKSSDWEDVRRRKKQPSPRERFCESRVAADTTHVIIGDSVAVPLKPNLMYPGSRCQNLSVSGVTLDDVDHWVSNIPVSPQIKVAVIHVGVNTCDSNTITERSWSAVIKKTKKVFPNAEITASSIVPPRGNHPLKKTVTASNEALQRACVSCKVTFIDNNPIFTTEKGAPRKALYKDSIHPSGQGTARLACHIKNKGEQRRRLIRASPDHLGSNNDSRATLVARDQSDTWSRPSDNAPPPSSSNQRRNERAGDSGQRQSRPAARDDEDFRASIPRPRDPEAVMSLSPPSASHPNYLQNGLPTLVNRPFLPRGRPPMYHGSPYLPPFLYPPNPYPFPPWAGLSHPVF